MKKATHSTKSGLHALVWQEGDLYVAKAVEVEVASQGKSSQEAVKNLEEAIELYFEDEPATLKVPKSSNLRLQPIFPNLKYA